MASDIKLEFNKKPSLFFYLSPLIALLRKSRTFQGIDTIPQISTRFLNTTIDPDHPARFNRLCSIEPPDAISPVYPITLVFVFFQYMLSLKQAPLSIFRVLGKRLRINQARTLQKEEGCDIHCRVADAKTIEKGLELDLEARIVAGNELVWSAVETFFYRGSFGEITQGRVKEKRRPLSDPQNVTSWFLPKGTGYQFAKISGDGNGLHYSKHYARLFGFERDFAQPFLIIGQALGAMADLPADSSISLDVEFKGQCYYKREISIKAEVDDPHRFDIYCQGNERPCMSAQIALEQVIYGCVI